MQIQDDDLTNGVILEEIKDQNKAILETLQPMPQMVKDIEQMKGDIEEIKVDNKAMKAVIKDHGHHIDDHETRITQLETASLVATLLGSDT